jgi:hypothetical protein
MTFENWKYYKSPLGENIGITIFHADGSQESRLLSDPEVVKWLEEGNTPEPADQSE